MMFLNEFTARKLEPNTYANRYWNIYQTETHWDQIIVDYKKVIFNK